MSGRRVQTLTCTLLYLVSFFFVVLKTSKILLFLNFLQFHTWNLKFTHEKIKNSSLKPFHVQFQINLNSFMPLILNYRLISYSEGLKAQLISLPKNTRHSYQLYNPWGNSKLRNLSTTSPLNDTIILITTNLFNFIFYVFNFQGLFKDKERYSTLTRMSYCQCRLKLVFSSIFKQFKFQHVALLLDRSDLFSLTVGKILFSFSVSI